MNWAVVLVVEEDEEVVGAGAPNEGALDVAELPELEPEELEELDPLVRTLPTARLTAVTRPAMGDVKVVPLYAVCAESTWDWATVTAASLAAILATAALLPSLAVSLSERAALADARFACAVSRAAFSVEVSSVARVSPAVTVLPAVTLTAVTVPDEAKFTSSCTAGVSVPEPATVFSMVWRLAVVVLVAAWAPCAPAWIPKPNQ
jgi:hypothetical protein